MTLVTPRRGYIGRSVASCASCMGWGPPYAQGLCAPCYRARSCHEPGWCLACGRVQPLKSGYCQLCRCQARLLRPVRSNEMIPFQRQVRHQQLFLTGLPSGKAKPGCASGRPATPGVAQPPESVSARPYSPWLQSPLFESPRRDYAYGRFNLGRDPMPDNPWLAWGVRVAHTLAEAHGWDARIREHMRRILVVLLANHADGDMIRASDIHRVLAPRSDSVKRTYTVLRIMGLLLDDGPRIFDAWLERKLGTLAPMIARDAAGWANALHAGGPRAKPRRQATIYAYIGAALPALRAWSRRYDHLREVTVHDVRDHITALACDQRHRAMTVLRSLFSWARRSHIVFRDPTAHLAVIRTRPLWQPLTPAQISEVVETADTARGRLVVALAAVHAARPAQIKEIQLQDIDVGNRRLTIAGRTRPMDELTHRLLVDYLHHRRERWPDTANPHLLLSGSSAPGLGPVSLPLLRRALPGPAATLERLRIDRQLEEALTSGADPLHLAAVFEICDVTAMRYAASARQLMITDVERPAGKTADLAMRGAPPGERGGAFGLVDPH